MTYLHLFKSLFHRLDVIQQLCLCPSPAAGACPPLSGSSLSFSLAGHCASSYIGVNDEELLVFAELLAQLVSES